MRRKEGQIGPRGDGQKIKRKRIDLPLSSHRERPLSEGKQLASWVDYSVRRATREDGRVFEGSFAHGFGTITPDLIRGEEKGLPQGGIGRHIENFVGNLDLDQVGKVNRRDASQEVRTFFVKWRDSYVTRVRFMNIPPNELQAVQNMSLKDVAHYAHEQFEKFKKAVGQAIPGSREFEDAEIQRDYWSRADEFLGPAADPDPNY